MPGQPRFLDRRAAGRALAPLLAHHAGGGDVLVLALPRGGVPVGFEVARALDAPLDIFLVRKLGVPGHEELALGAIASGGVRVLNPRVVRSSGVTAEQIQALAERERAELVRREYAYRGGRPPPEVRGRTVILVDDGLATGASMRAALRALRALHPACLVAAAPVAAADTCRELAAEADEMVCVETPEPFWGVGVWYQDFSQTTDQEVCALLGQAVRPDEARAP